MNSFENYVFFLDTQLWGPSRSHKSPRGLEVLTYLHYVNIGQSDRAEFIEKMYVS